LITIPLRGQHLVCGLAWNGDDVATADNDEGESEQLDRALASFTANERRAEAVRARHLLEDRRVVDAISGTFLGTLTEIAESRHPVAVLTRSGSTHRGVFTSIGPDVAVVELSGDDRRLLLSLDAIEGIREVGIGHNRSVVSPPTGAQFAEILDTLSEDRPRLVITTRGGNRVMGALIRAGENQVTVKLDGDGDVLTVPIGVIDEATIG